MAANNPEKHVCFVVPNASSFFSTVNQDFAGGAEIQQVLLGKAIAKAGYKVTFVVNDVGQPARQTFDNIDVAACPFRYYGGSNKYFPVDTVRLIKLLKDIGAHYYLMKTPLSMLFAMGIHRALFGGKLINIIANDPDCYKQAWNSPDKLYDIGVKFVDTTIFQTEKQRLLAKEHLGLDGTVVPNIAHTPGIKEGDVEKDLDAIWAGTSVPRKQPELFLDLAERLPHRQFAMMMLPIGDEAYRNMIITRAEALPNVDFLGFVPYAETFRHYARARLLANTSHTEGFPNVFLQAWQLGVPVVSLNIDPDRVIETHGLGAILHGDLDAMAERLEALLDNDAEREALAANSRKYIDDTHHPDVIARRFIEVFESC